MGDTKTYYWLKLQNNFFNSLEIKTVLKHEKGAEYVIFWQKLLLEVIDKIDSGFIRYKESIPYTPDVLATITDTDIDTVKGAMTLFIKMQMIEISESGDLIIDEVIHEMIGRITDEGVRKSNYRKKIKELKSLGQCPVVSQNVPTILELEIEKDIEIHKEKDIDDKSSLPEMPLKKTKSVKTKLTEQQNQYKNKIILRFSEEFREVTGEPLVIDGKEIGAVLKLLHHEWDAIDKRIRRLKTLLPTNPTYFSMTPSCLLSNWNKLLNLKVY